MIAHQGAHSSRMMFQDAVDRPIELARDYPMSSVLLVFGVGLGVGLVLSQAISSPFGQMMQPEPTMTEKIGQRVMEAIRPMLPDSIARSCHLA